MALLILSIILSPISSFAAGNECYYARACLDDEPNGGKNCTLDTTPEKADCTHYHSKYYTAWRCQEKNDLSELHYAGLSVDKRECYPGDQPYKSKSKKCTVKVCVRTNYVKNSTGQDLPKNCALDQNLSCTDGYDGYKCDTDGCDDDDVTTMADAISDFAGSYNCTCES